MPYLKKILKISGVLVLIIALLLVVSATLIKTEWAQNWLVNMATSRLSKSLNVKIDIKRVRLSLFNRLYMEGTLVKDRNQDTLLYAGALKVSITDWFFVKNEAELHYLGLDNAVINLQRKDSIWNYQFLLDFFSSPKPKDTTKSNIALSLKRIEFNNIRILQEDEWIGQNMTANLGHLDLKADEINFDKKKIFINSVELVDPYFAIYDYEGKRPERPKVPEVIDTSAGQMQWNKEDWDILITKLEMKNGTFKNDLQTLRQPYPYFDGNHLQFASINATMKNISWQKDTIAANIKISTKERSGFTVNSLKANLSFHPKGMIFKQLDIQTPNSRLTNFYAMRYSDFQPDMADFIHKVKMEGSFINSTLSSVDIAYFAPELKDLKKVIRLNGNVSGTVDNLTAKNFKLEYGANSKLYGDIKMKGLPDIEKTKIDFQANEFHTTYADAVSFVPSLKDIKELKLQELGYVRFKGNFTGFLSDFVAFGTIETALGKVSTDINMKLPKGREPFYSGKIETPSFNLGKLIGRNDIGVISFNGIIKGSGFDAKSAAIDINGDINSFEWNGYTFQNVKLTGDLKEKQFTGDGIIDDPNLKGTLKGSFNLNENEPEYNLLVDIQRGNLKEINLTKTEMNVLGKFRLNFKGKTVDDFIGEASLFDVALTTKGQVYVFDTLNLYSMRIDDRKQIEIFNSDIYISINGIFTILDLPQTINSYLSKYYPIYFKEPATAIINQDFTFRADLKNIDQYLPLLNTKLRGLDNSTINGSINTNEKIFLLNAKIPYLAYDRQEVRDFALEGIGNLDSLRINASAGMIVMNDSLQIPSSRLIIKSSRDISAITLITSENEAQNTANLSLTMQNLKDGIRLNFNQSSIVFNEKTWQIEGNGELTVSKSYIGAENIRIVNGRQEILVSSLPSEIGNSNDILISLNRVNLGDILPYVLKEPKVEGITSGDITIEDPYNRLKVYVNAQTEQTRFENDSIGIISLNAFWDNTLKKASYFVNSNNQGYIFDVKGNVNLADSNNKTIETDFDILDTRIDILENYLGIVFSDMNGNASGKLKISGQLKEPEITGKLQIKNGGLNLLYTQCYYTLQDPVIEFKPDVIDFGTINIKDKYGNEGQIKGELSHHFFRDFKFDFSATSKKLLLLNTTKQDNNIFYGKAIGRMNFFFKGPEKDMKMYVDGEVLDSSVINIVTSTNSKQSGNVDYIIWKQYGREMNFDSLFNPSSNLSIDLDLTANNLLKMNVILDELSGDVISAIGKGNIKIHTGTNESLTLNGRYNIDKGNYNFNFQDIFKKPFTLDPGSGSFISWTGDPYDAEININATYLAEQVRMSTLFSEANSSGVSSVSSDILRELSDVQVLCKLTGTLGQPNPSFSIILPANSPVRNNPTVDSKLKAINRDPLEVSKQSTYLIVFKSFAPQSAIVATDLNQELINNTISGVINAILASSVQSFFNKFFGNSVDVNFNYSRIATDVSGNGINTGTTTSDYRENVSLQFIKSLMNDKLIITFGSDFNFTTGSAGVTSAQTFLFLPDVNVEYKITPDGKFRTSFFYRSTYDQLSTTGMKNRAGGNISFRTEFDHIIPRKKKKTTVVAEPDLDSSTSGISNKYQDQ